MIFYCPSSLFLTLAGRPQVSLKKKEEEKNREKKGANRSSRGSELQVLQPRLDFESRPIHIQISVHVSFLRACARPRSIRILVYMLRTAPIQNPNLTVEKTSQPFIILILHAIQLYLYRSM